MTFTLRQTLNSYTGMTKRNVLLFFKDKTTLLFSMLAPIIVFLLYIIFLKNAYLDGLKDASKDFGDLISLKDIDSVTNAWLLAGVLGTSAITVSLNSLQVMVKDKENKIDYDYTSSPIPSVVVILAYFTGAFLNTFIITGLILTLGLIILSLIGSLYLTFEAIILLYLVTILASASSTIIMMVVVSFFKRSSALGAFSGIISAAIGFIIGAYIPLGEFSEAVQGIMALVPGSHISCLYRNLLMTGVIDHINTSLNGIDKGMFAESIKNTFALNLNMFNYITPKSFMYLYTSASILVALLLNTLFYKRANRRI